MLNRKARFRTVMAHCGVGLVLITRCISAHAATPIWFKPKAASHTAIQTQMPLGSMDRKAWQGTSANMHVSVARSVVRRPVSAPQSPISVIRENYVTGGSWIKGVDIPIKPIPGLSLDAHKTTTSGGARLGAPFTTTVFMLALKWRF